VTVHFLVPEGVDDHRRPSGGNVYDRRLSFELARLGWTVREHGVTGRSLAGTLAALPDGVVAVVDGLVASAPAMQAEARRLRLVVLLHMPVGGATERAVLAAADAVVATSRWTRAWVLRHHELPAERVRVAVPGMDRGPRVVGSTSGGSLVTAGDVIFQPIGSDLYALDARSGRTLFKQTLPRNIRATPLTYNAGGRQYVTIVATAEVTTFALP